MSYTDLIVKLDRIVDVVSIATTEPVTKAEVKANLGIITADTTQDDLLDDKIEDARIMAEGATSYSLIQRTYDLYQNGFGGISHITIPSYPVISVTSVNTTDEDGTELEFSSSFYTTDTTHKPGRVYLNDDAVWPTDLRSFKSVRVRYVAGYTQADVDNKPPMDIQGSIVRMASFCYRVGGTGILFDNKE